MRSLPAPQALWKVLLVMVSLLCALPMHAQAQTQAKPPAKTKAKAKPKKSKSKGKAKAQEPAQAQAPEPEKAKAQEPAPAQPQVVAQEPAPAAAPEKALTPPPEKAQAPEKPQDKAPKASKAPAPKAQAQKAPEKPKAPEKKPEPEPIQAQGPSKLRIGLGLDLFTENSRLTGEQAINAARRDESFDYKSSGILSATLSLSIPAPIASDRTRIGAGVRLFGNYNSTRGEEDQEQLFGFGLLNQVFISGEYGLPVANRTEALFGARGGLSFLLPGGEFSDEIDRLRANNVSVWKVPRVGWLLGLSVGARRRMTEHIALRADLNGQLEKLYLFATSQDVDGIRFNKDWSTTGLRLGLAFGVDFSI